MIEILKQCMILASNAVNEVYNIELEFTTGHYVKFGNIMLATAVFFIMLYWIFVALGIFNRNGDD